MLSVVFAVRESRTLKYATKVQLLFEFCKFFGSIIRKIILFFGNIIHKSALFMEYKLNKCY